MASRRRAFTLIELLVVVVLLGALAALLLPVFARARQSARKSHCLANVKSIATAFQMYLSDYERFPPALHDAEAECWLTGHPGGQGKPGAKCSEQDNADPYLRHQVVLDTYLTSREVWRCPSARTSVTASWILPERGVWWDYLRKTAGHWGAEEVAGGPCLGAFPSGWGGEVTDSIAQQRRAGPETGAFECTLGTSSLLADVQEAEIQDPTWLVVCADSQHWAQFSVIADVLYSLCRTNSDCACGDWSEGETCMLPPELVGRWHTDPGFRATYTRHLGGANLGFADGHARWWSAQALTAATPYCECCSPQADYDGSFLNLHNRPLRGLCPAGVG